jgi:hypothetical protein
MASSQTSNQSSWALKHQSKSALKHQRWMISNPSASSQRMTSHECFLHVDNRIQKLACVLCNAEVDDEGE